MEYIEYTNFLGVTENIFYALLTLSIVLSFFFFLNYAMRIYLKRRKEKIEADIIYTRNSLNNYDCNQLKIFLTQIERDLEEIDESTRVRKLIELWTWTDFIRTQLDIIFDLQIKLNRIKQWLKDKGVKKGSERNARFNSIREEYQELIDGVEEKYNNDLFDYQSRVFSLYRGIFINNSDKIDENFFKVSY